MILLCPFTATPGESTLWLKYKKYRNQFVFIYNKADHCDSEEQRVENVIGMSHLLGAKQITRTITDDLKEGQKAKYKPVSVQALQRESLTPTLRKTTINYGDQLHMMTRNMKESPCQKSHVQSFKEVLHSDKICNAHVETRISKTV